MKQYIDKLVLVAEIERRIKTNKECMLGLRNLDYYQSKVDALNDIISFINALEVKEVDLEKEKVENIKKQCPFREIVCNKYQDHPLKCSGACAFVSDRITSEKKHLHDIQNVPVDEERLKMDRRNTV